MLFRSLVDGRQVAFLFLPEGEDPDSFVRANGREAFEELLDRAQPLSEFMLRELTARVDMRSAEGKARFLQQVKPMLAEIKAPMLSLVLRKQVAELAGLPQGELESQFGIKNQMRTKSAPARKSAERPSVLRHLAEILLVSPGLARLADIERFCQFADVAAHEFSKDEIDLVLGLLEIGKDSPNVQGLVERFRGTHLESLVARFQAAALFAREGHENDEKALEEDFAGAWQKVEQYLNNAGLKALMAKGSPKDLSEEDKEKYRQLIRSRRASSAAG